MLTPVQRQVATVSSAMKPVSLPFSHLMGSNPRKPTTWFISAVGDSLKIRRKMMPATTTEVSAGMKRIDLKMDLNLSLPIFELISTASRSGTGIRMIRVQMVYLTELPRARKNRRSLKSRW